MEIKIKISSWEWQQDFAKLVILEKYNVKSTFIHCICLIEFANKFARMTN